MKTSEGQNSILGSWNQEFRVAQKLSELAGHQVHCGYNILLLSFSFFKLSIFEKLIDKRLVLSCQFLLRPKFLLQFLLLEWSLKLILIFECAPSHGLLPLNRFLVFKSRLLSHLLLVCHLLLISLQLQLNLIFGSSFWHFCLVLEGLTPFFLLDLWSLNFHFARIGIKVSFVDTYTLLSSSSN